MSAGSDNVFARWSRRKQAMLNGGKPLPHEVERGSDADAVQADVQRAEHPGQPLSAEPDAARLEAAVPTEPLPRLEDLTAESDLSAFLREGVPKALKSAAMRRMWSLDPAIRDYVGPSEYAWDFNQPGCMSGFGPLDPNNTGLADFLSTMSGRVQAGLAEAASSNGGSPPKQATAPSSDETRPSPDVPVDTVPAEGPLEPQHLSTGHQAHSPVPMEPAAEPAEAPEPSRSRQYAQPRHGRATPR